MTRVDLRKREDDIKNMYESGESLKSIGSTLGTSAGTIKRILTENETEIRKPHEISLSSYDKEKIVIKYKCGMSVRQLSEEFEVGNMDVYRVLKDNSVKMRDE